MARQSFKKFNLQVPIKEDIENIEDIGPKNLEEKEELTVKNLLDKIETKERSSYEFKFIPRNLIRENLKNNYPQEKIDVMKESILNYGLQQNLSVVYLQSENEYIIEAGHTRFMALNELIQEFSNFDNFEDNRYKLYKKNVLEFEKKGFPCKVSDSLSENTKYYYDSEIDLEEIPETVIDSEIRLIITNEIKREDVPAIKAKNIARLEQLYKRKNLGKKKKDKININEKIGSDLNMTARQVIKYKNVNKLIPGLQKAFADNKISLNDSSNYANLSTNDQEMVLNLLDQGKKVTNEEIKALEQEKIDLKNRLEKKEQELKIKEKELLEERKKNQSVLLKEKEKEIADLKKESIKLQEKIKTTKNIDSLQTEIKKIDIEFSITFDEVKKSIDKFKEVTKELSKYTKDIDNDNSISFTTSKEINSKWEQLNSIVKEYINNVN